MSRAPPRGNLRSLPPPLFSHSCPRRCSLCVWRPFLPPHLQRSRRPRRPLLTRAFCLASVCFFPQLCLSPFSTTFGRGPSVLLTLLLPATDTEYTMARYSAFLGRRVEVQYRAGDILLPASGMFVADSGRSIFLEQNFEQKGQHKHFRWEIPYQYLVRIEEKPDSGATVNTVSAPAKSAPAPEAAVTSKSGNGPRSA